MSLLKLLSLIRPHESPTTNKPTLTMANHAAVCTLALAMCSNIRPFVLTQSESDSVNDWHLTRVSTISVCTRCRGLGCDNSWVTCRRHMVQALVQSPASSALVRTALQCWLGCCIQLCRPQLPSSLQQSGSSSDAYRQAAATSTQTAFHF